MHVICNYTSNSSITSDGIHSGHRTMYGSINENLTEELIQRSGMAARSRRDKSKSYTGLLCSSSSSDEAFPPDVFTDIGSGMGQVMMMNGNIFESTVRPHSKTPCTYVLIGLYRCVSKLQLPLAAKHLVMRL
jgi:hypothetical protein